MNMEQIREKARGLGVKPGRMKKSDLIKTIQVKEGNFACFGTSGGSCDQVDCCWRSECLSH